jgi:hypothetical protein
MEIIKRKILLEDAIYRGEPKAGLKYGQFTADTFYVNIMLTQNIDDMGMFTDHEFISGSTSPSSQPDYTILENKLIASGITFPFMLGVQPPLPLIPPYTGNIRVVGKELEDYWVYADQITGSTDSKVSSVKGYNNQQQFITNFDIKKTTYENYLGDIISGRTRVTQQSVSATTYVIDANNDSDIGTINQTTGLLYIDYSGITRTVTDDFGTTQIPLTNFQYMGEGWNTTNTSLSALTKEEYLFGITQPPEVYSDVFIDRGATTVLEMHLRLSEVESLEHLERYNNGFYKIVDQ